MPYTALEVKEAIFQVGATKSLGLGGMPTHFFTKYWDLDGNDVIVAILIFLNNGDFLVDINKTFVVLIPKMPNAQNMKQYRPIFLCNVFYKIISKVLANRLKVILPLIILESRSAFIQNKYITDNILIAYELIHPLKSKRSRNKGYMAMKLDMSKAYERVEWSFLEAMMRKMKLKKGWISRII